MVNVKPASVWFKFSIDLEVQPARLRSPALSTAKSSLLDYEVWHRLLPSPACCALGGKGNRLGGKRKRIGWKTKSFGWKGETHWVEKGIVWVER